MKIKEVMNRIEDLRRLEKNLSKLYSLSCGCAESFPDKKKTEEISERIADFAAIDSPLGKVLFDARGVVRDEANRLQEIVSETEIDITL